MRLPAFELSAADLNELGRVFPGCAFDDPQRRDFLECMKDRDVQAAPGSGKTTLLVAKLHLLARHWSASGSGICVISHTNAAQREVEEKLAARASGILLLGYPHFIGTITTFLHRFLALPFLRGLGWPIKRIDDDVFQSSILSRLRRKPALLAYSRRRHTVQTIVRNLALSVDFEEPASWPPSRVRVRQQYDMPRDGTPTRRELEELKAELISDGIYNFEDMTSLAARALQEVISLRDRLASRFPIVFIDEAQDTSGSHRAILESVFRGRSTMQWIGDCNQAIFDNEEASESGEQVGWQPATGYIDLGDSCRFGRRIAEFATHLTVRKRQVIAGRRASEGKHTLILFDESSIGNVLPRFCEIVVEQFSNWFDPTFQAWAVASRHRRGSSDRVPESLCDYHAMYQAAGVKRDGVDRFIDALRDAAQLARNGHRLDEQLTRIAGAVIELFDRQGVTPPGGTRWRRDLVFQVIDELAPGAGVRVMRVLRNAIISGAPRSDADWRETAGLLQAIVEQASKKGINGNARAFLDFSHTSLTDAAAFDDGSRLVHRVGDRALILNLGSIHSVKGQTHDATLVLESFPRTADLHCVLPAILGRAALPGPDERFKYRAVTNIFVAVTRPRHLLCLAASSKAVSHTHINRATELGWRVDRV